MTEENEAAPIQQITELIADAFTFVRSAEANRELATVTLEDLIEDQISRNGDPESAGASQYNPYVIQPSEGAPATEVVVPDQVSGTRAASASKLERLLAIKNSIHDMVSELKERDPSEVASADEYSAAYEDFLIVE